MARRPRRRPVGGRSRVSARVVCGERRAPMAASSSPCRRRKSKTSARCSMRSNAGVSTNRIRGPQHGRRGGRACGPRRIRASSASYRSPAWSTCRRSSSAVRAPAAGAPMLGKPECPWSPALAEDAARIGSVTSQAGADSRAVAAGPRRCRRARALPGRARRTRRGGGRPELVTLPGVDHRFTGASRGVEAVVPWLRARL